MTREEAIETLKANYPDPCFEMLRDAVDEAIKALKAQIDKDIDVPSNDVISRQAVIDGFYEMASDTDHLCTVADYVKFLESMSSEQPEQQWIPVSERLPKEGQQIIATVADNSLVGVYIIRGYYKKMHKSVIAWMPLPEPWKGESNANNNSQN